MSDEIRSDVGPWTMIPEWLLDAEIGDRAVRLYALLGRYADASGSGAYPSRRTLAKRLRCSTDTVDRATHELVDIGALIVKARFRENERTTNAYTLIRVAPSRTDAATVAAGDAATPSRTGAAQTESHLDLEPTELETPAVAIATSDDLPAPKLTRINGHDLAFDVLADQCGVDIKGPRAREVAIALNGSKQQGDGIRVQFWRSLVQPGMPGDRPVGEHFEIKLAEAIRHRAAMYRSKMAGALLTPLALAKWWSDLPGMRGGSVSAQDVFEVAQREIDEARGVRS